MAQMMRDITYDTTLWDAKPDIVNHVFLKLTSVNSGGWPILSASKDRWTSSRYSQTTEYSYYSTSGNLEGNFFYNRTAVTPITLYEF